MLCPPGVSCEGAVIAYFAKAMAGVFPSVNAKSGAAVPAFPGDPDKFIEAHGKTDEIRSLMLNKVKKCSVCAKPNGFTLESCNSCGNSLRDTPLSHSFNVFMGFVFGIEKGPFPYTISLRYEDRDVLVIDDLLALAPMHLNVIPTSHFIPDWRYLLRQPQEAQKLVNMMLEKCQLVAREQFLSNDAFVGKYFNPKTLSEFDVVRDIAAGFNFPPSQNQLHIQFILPVLTPFHFAQYIKGVHYTQRRFFPVSYVLKCLELASQGPPIPPEILAANAPIDAVIDFFRSTHKLDYDVLHAQFYSEFRVTQQKYANWKQEDFEGIAVEYGRCVMFLDAKTKEAVPSVVPAQLASADKTAIMSYGRPFSPDGKPTGSYYSYAKQPKDLALW